ASGVMRPWYVRLTLSREALHRRIAARVDRMLAAGLVDEVRGLLRRGVPPQAPGLDGIGYREVVAMLEGRLRPDALREAIVAATRRYAKRQETWFRHQLRATGDGRGEPCGPSMRPSRPPSSPSASRPAGTPPPVPRPASRSPGLRGENRDHVLSDLRRLGRRGHRARARPRAARPRGALHLVREPVS